MVFVEGATIELEFDCDGGEVGREKLPNIHSFRVDGLDVMVKRYVKRQHETVDVVYHGKHDAGRHFLKGRRLPSTDLTCASFIRS